ncbi:MAG TPA: HAD family hydrolase [Anaerolineae bacterium]|nr:HAD family hydrolase [Anaerolineae bacterium]
MIEVNVPGWGRLRLVHLMLDVNGTIAVDGRLVDGVAGRLVRLRERLQVHLLTADTQGRQAELDAQLGLRATRIARGQEQAQKAARVQELGAEEVCYVGNGANDAEAMRAAALGIAVMGEEGLALETLQAADVLVPSITAALDLLLRPARLVATLRR